MSAKALMRLTSLRGRKPNAAADFEVAKATLKDVDDLVILAETFRTEHSSKWGEGSMGQWARWQVKGSVQAADHVVVIGRAGGTPVGYCSGVVDRSAAVALGKIEAVYVLPGFRGTGLAARLLDAAIEGLVARGAGHLELLVAADNSRAQTFFASFGFKDSDRVMGLALGAGEVGPSGNPAGSGEEGV